MRDGQNGYAPSMGILAAREAVAEELSGRGMPVAADRVVITSGTSEGIELALTALVESGDEVLIPCPTYPLYTAVLAKLGARGGVLSHRSRRRLAAGPRSRREPGDARDPRARRHRSEQSDRGELSAGHTARAHRHCRPSQHPAPRRRGLRRSRLCRPGSADGEPRAGRAHPVVLVVVEGVSRAGLARRVACGRTH